MIAQSACVIYSIRTENNKNNKTPTRTRGEQTAREKTQKIFRTIFRLDDCKVHFRILRMARPRNNQKQRSPSADRSETIIISSGEGFEDDVTSKSDVIAAARVWSPFVY